MTEPEFICINTATKINRKISTSTASEVAHKRIGIISLQCLLFMQDCGRWKPPPDSRGIENDALLELKQCAKLECALQNASGWLNSFLFRSSHKKYSQSISARGYSKSQKAKRLDCVNCTAQKLKSSGFLLLISLVAFLKPSSRWPASPWAWARLGSA